MNIRLFVDNQIPDKEEPHLFCVSTMEELSEIEWQAAGSSDENLRKRDRDRLAESENLNNLKKARYAWQVKGVKNDCKEGAQVTEILPHVLSETATETIHDNVAQSSTSNEECAASSNKETEPIDDNDEILEMLTQSSGNAVEEPVFAVNRSDRIRDLTNRFLEQRAPQLDIFSSTVSIVTNPHCHWQKEELGCAIVDNVFNRTLEEIGISPDPKVNRASRFIEQTLENQGIESAIRVQGLRASRSGSSTVGSPNTDSSRHRIGPHENLELDNSNQYTGRVLQPQFMTSGWIDERASTSCSKFIDSGESSKSNDSKPQEFSNETINTAVAGCSNSGAMNNTGNTGDFADIENNLSIRDGNGRVGENVSDSLVAEVCGQRSGNNNSSAVKVDENKDGYMLDLAVSTAIKAQGLSVNTK